MEVELAVSIAGKSGGSTAAGRGRYAPPGREGIMTKHGLALILVAASIVAAPSRAAGDEALASLPPDRLAERIRAELAFAEGLALPPPGPEGRVGAARREGAGARGER